jgi:ribosomal protein L11 methyltransferase
MAWQQLSLDTRYPDFAEEILESQGALSVSVLPAEGAESIFEPGPGETPQWSRARLTALFEEAADLDAVRLAVSELLPDAAEADPEQDEVADTDWVRNCLDAMAPMRFGERLWIAPHHREVDDPTAVVVKLDPGLAFGTGTHPTTDLCLRWLDGAEIEGARVLDYGCGSGILAVAALALGAHEAVGVDNDPQAVRATAENARNNGVDERLRYGLSTEHDVGAGYDVVLANILAEPLIRLAPTLLATLRPGGWIVLAGLLDRQAERVMEAYPGIDWQQASCDGWTRLAGCSKSTAE